MMSAFITFSSEGESSVNTDVVSYFDNRWYCVITSGEYNFPRGGVDLHIESYVTSHYAHRANSRKGT